MRLDIRWTLPLACVLPIAGIAIACSGADDDGAARSAAALAPEDRGTPFDERGGGGQPDPVDVRWDVPWDPPNESGSVAFPYTAYRCGYAVRQVSPSRPTAAFHGSAVGDAPAPKNLHLTIAGNAATSVVFSWATDATTSATEVRFGDAPDRLDRVARGFSFPSAASRRQHELHLCGLRPGTTYYYDAGGAAGRSPVYKFTTAPEGPSEVTILVGGDMRNNPGIWAANARAAMAFGPTVALFSGDAVATGGQQAQWDALFAAAPEFFAQVPGLWSNGNHEALDELYFRQFALPDHLGGTTQIEEWYAATYGPLRAIFLNDSVSNSAQISGSEKQFLKASLEAVDRKRTPFVLTIHHKPMYTTSSGHSSDMRLRNEWGPLLAQFKVNADISGHVHSYESTKPIVAGTTNVTTDAAGGTRFFVEGGGGAPLYGFAAEQPWIQAREKTNGFAILKVDANRMLWTAYRKDGSTLDSVTLPRR